MHRCELACVRKTMVKKIYDAAMELDQFPQIGRVRGMITP
jgi:hypothetical protein